jgi:hypothetical protein
MPQENPELQAFVDECVEEYYNAPYEDGTSRLATEAIVSLITLLAYEGLKLCLPELREWLKLGASVITLKRLEIEKKLKKYAEQKELDYKEAKKAAKAIADRLDEKNVGTVINAIETTLKS